VTSEQHLEAGRGRVLPRLLPEVQHDVGVLDAHGGVQGLGAGSGTQAGRNIGWVWAIVDLGSEMQLMEYRDN